MVTDTTRCGCAPVVEVTSPYNNVGWPLVAALCPDSDVPKTAASCVGVTGALMPVSAETTGPGVGPGATVDVGPGLSLVPALGVDPDECELHAASATATPKAAPTAASTEFTCTE